MTVRPELLLLDIEGTIAPISFVHDVLFPYARDRLAGFVSAHAGEADIAAALAELDTIAPGAPPVATLLELMDRDAKIGPLKLIQGRIWAEGFAAGELTGRLYPDVAPALRAWRAGGLRLAIYSSGSEEAQRLLLRHTADGDLTGLFDQFFDTRIGGKRDAASYAAIARALGLAPAQVLFLSDVAAELAAAAAAGLKTTQIVRAEDQTIASPDHPTAPDIAAVMASLGCSDLV